MGAGGFQGLQDMIDGGGAGMAGDTFQGGAMSDIANRLGIRPAGYNDRMQMQDQNQQTLQQLMPQQAGMSTQGPMGVPAPSPVQTSPLPASSSGPPNQSGMPPSPPTPQMNPPFVGFDGQPSPAMGYQPGQGAGQSGIEQYYQMIEAHERGLI